MSTFSRRKFLKASGAFAAVVAAAPSLGAETLNNLFTLNDAIPVAPNSNYVGFSVLVSPEQSSSYWKATWEFSSDIYFENILAKEVIQYQDTTPVKLEISLNNLKPGSQVYYRVLGEGCHIDTEFDESDDFKTYKFSSTVPTEALTRVNVIESQDASATHYY